MNIEYAERLLKEMRDSCLKDWSGEPGHYNDPKKEAKAQALQFGIWGMEFCSNIENLVKAYDGCIDASNKEHILTKDEREYLAAVIKPSRQDVICLKKVMNVDGKMKEDAVQITFDNGSSIRTRWLPAGKVYAGMKVGKSYSPEELGL